jgi:hypothetical protein
MTKAKISKSDQRELDEINKKIGQLPLGEDASDMEALDIIKRAATRLSKTEKGAG